MPLVKSDDYAFLVDIYSAKDKFAEEKKPSGFSKRQEKIIRYLKDNNKINTTSCSKVLGVSTDTALREITKLRIKGIITRRGVGRAIYYLLK